MRTTSTGNPGLRSTPREDVRMGVCPRQTVLRVGGADSRGGRGTVTGNASESDELTTTEVAQSNDEAGPR